MDSLNLLEHERAFVTYPSFGEALLALPGDGLVLFAAALAFLLLYLRHGLRDQPKWVAWALGGIVLAGAALRLALSEPAPMEGWFYFRVAPLADRIFRGPVLQLATDLTGGTVYQTDVNFWTTFALAVVTPLVYFGHARFVLRDVRAGVVAAAVLALLPIHIRFSRSDVFNVQVVALSSLSFIAVYAALTEENRRWRIASVVALPFLCVATYFSRPDAIIYFPLDLVAAYVASRDGVPAKRRWLVLGLVGAAGAYATVVNVLGRYGGTADAVLSVETLKSAWRMVTDDMNRAALLNQGITPLPLAALAIAGAIVLWRRGDRMRLFLLGSWLVGFFVITSYVSPPSATMGARYQLPLATPFVLLIAAATPAVLRAGRVVTVAIALWIAAAPALTAGFERDVAFDEIQEFKFLETLREEIPEGCTVLEFREAMVFANPVQPYYSRLERIGRRLKDGAHRPQWKVVDAGETRVEQGRVVEALSKRAAQLARIPPRCLMAYEGLSCLHSRANPGAIAAPCASLHEQFGLAPRATRELESRDYAIGCSGEVLLPQRGGEEPRREGPRRTGAIRLTLYRATAKDEVASTPAR